MAHDKSPALRGQDPHPQETHSLSRWEVREKQSQ